MPDLMPQEVAAMLQGYTPHFERIPKAPKAELTAPTVRFLRASWGAVDLCGTIAAHSEQTNGSK
jgi:hypothetical protein